MTKWAKGDEIWWFDTSGRKILQDLHEINLKHDVCISANGTNVWTYSGMFNTYGDRAFYKTKNEAIGAMLHRLQEMGIDEPEGEQ